MIDGRFDQHFLEIFAGAQTEAKDGARMPWIALIVVISASVAMGIGTIFLA